MSIDAKDAREERDASVVAKIVAAVRDASPAPSRAARPSPGELFPPLVRFGADGLFEHRRWLAGARDARELERWLQREDMAPLRWLLAALAQDCERWRARSAAWCAPELWRIDNAALFGPLVREAFAVCALGRRDRLPVIAALHRGFVSALDRFSLRLVRDLRAGKLGEVARAGGAKRAPVRALVAHMEETHNGRQFVLEVRLRGGRAWAYKPRPLDGELTMNALMQRLGQLKPAAGRPRLPILRAVRGGGKDGTWYGWHEWVEPPRRLEPVGGRGAQRQLLAARLTVPQAARFWYGAGCLAAFCLAFGVTDQFAHNIRIGARRGSRTMELYPIDLELFGYPLQRLGETGLLAVEGQSGRSPGLGRAAIHHSDDGALAYFDGVRDPAVVRGRAPMRRTLAPELMTDDDGNVGYAAHLAPLLRGLFDQWVTVLQRKAQLATFLRKPPAPRSRVVVRHTAEYATAIDAAMLGEEPPWSETPWSRAERAQLERFDAPYFLRRAGATAEQLEPLEIMTAPPEECRALPVPEQPYATAFHAPVPLVARLDKITLAALGLAMRDVVTSVASALPRTAPELAAIDDRRHGLSVHLDAAGGGSVGVAWREAKKRLVFCWDAQVVRVEIYPLDERRGERDATPAVATSAVVPAIRKKLLRLDRIDAVLRDRFQKSGFTDRATERDLEKLVAGAVTWMDEILDERGWPGHSLVGKRAAAAACRLAQHADRAPAFQRRCLAMLAEAVRHGEATPRQLAYLTDQVRMRSGERQLYGTKFRRRRGQLVPFPIEDAAAVDERRRQMGMESLAAYTRKIRRTFGAEAT